MILLLILSMFLFACGKAAPVIEIDPVSAKQYIADNYDKIAIDGSTSMIPLHQSLNGLFKPDSEEDIYHSKTVDAFLKFIGGENDILLGVDYSDELLEQAKNSGVDLVKLEITREAFIFLINRNNPVANLTTAQIKDIYSGKITNWSEIGGDDAPITAYQRNSDSGSQIRMEKFMSDSELMTNDVEYISSMGWVIEQMANYDEGRHSIAYNIYTFAEKQYVNSDVTLLSVDGVYPDDNSVFDGTYPITIYNYIYYNANNTAAAEFAINLHAYLMSDEGQQVISDAGYVNLNKQLDRNTDVTIPYDYGYDYGREIGFHDKVKGEFYEIDNDNNVLIYYNYPDCILHNTPYIENENARNFVTMIADSGIMLAPTTLSCYPPYIKFDLWFDASYDPEDFFNIRYKDKYYNSFKYFIEDDKYVLTASEQRIYDDYKKLDYVSSLSAYMDVYEPDISVELTKDDLKDVFFRTREYGDYSSEEITLNYYQIFK